MTEKRFQLAYCNDDWWAICDNVNYKERGIWGQEVVDLINEFNDENTKLKFQNEELLYQIGRLGKNNQTCRECECFISEIKYCYMWDMEVGADDIVVACDQRKVKNEVIKND